MLFRSSVGRCFRPQKRLRDSRGYAMYDFHDLVEPVPRERSWNLVFIRGSSTHTFPIALAGMSIVSSSGFMGFPTISCHSGFVNVT